MPLHRDRENPENFVVNDVLGNYSLTLIDSLTTLAIFASSGDPTTRSEALAKFQNGIGQLVGLYGDGSDGSMGHGSRANGFDVDSKVQVFETVIRGIGGLLSAHLFAVGELPMRDYVPGDIKANSRFPGARSITWRNGFVYDGQLLRLAHDLGKRLLPAFFTPTGIPYPRVNLRHGIPFYLNSPLFASAESGKCTNEKPAPKETTETCAAGAGSLVLELTTLSRLTGDTRFETLGKRAFWEIWSRRSNIGLVGSGIDAESGLWAHPITGVSFDR